MILWTLDAALFCNICLILFTIYRVTHFGGRFCTWKQKKRKNAYIHMPCLILFQSYVTGFFVLTNCICITSRDLSNMTSLLPNTNLETFYHWLYYPFLFSKYCCESLVQFSREVIRRCQRINYSNIKLIIIRKEGQTVHLFIWTCFTIFMCRIHRRNAILREVCFSRWTKIKNVMHRFIKDL